MLEPMETLIVERSESGVVSVTLNRPEKKNAIDATMWDELMGVFREVAESASDRVLVLTGSGGAFCAGADLSPVPGEPRHQLDRMHHFGWVGLALHEIPKPNIA
jgi:2-(1,2-epoxy-1,2-dihydrophenyl)acetyl-CoA isomerase